MEKKWVNKYCTYTFASEKDYSYQVKTLQLDINALPKIYTVYAKTKCSYHTWVQVKPCKLDSSDNLWSFSSRILTKITNIWTILQKTFYFLQHKRISIAKSRQSQAKCLNQQQQTRFVQTAIISMRKAKILTYLLKRFKTCSATLAKTADCLSFIQRVTIFTENVHCKCGWLKLIRHRWIRKEHLSTLLQLV